MLSRQPIVLGAKACTSWKEVSSHRQNKKNRSCCETDFRNPLYSHCPYSRCAFDSHPFPGKGSWLGALSKVCSDSLRRAFYDFDFSHDDPSLRAGEIGSFAKAFLISHAHLDHILGMVLGSASLPGKRAVYGLKSTLNNLMGMFDGKLWPKLASFKEDEPFIVYHLKPVESQSPIVLDDSLTVLPFALSHGLIASSVPAPPTPTPLPSRSSYFSKRYSLPLSSLVPLATGGAVRQLASSKDRPFGEKPVFTSPFAPDRNVQAYQEGSGGSDVAPDSHDGGRDKADQYAVAQSHTAKAPLPLRDLAAARRPKTASGSERAVGTPPASAPAGPTIDESGHNTPSSPPPVPPKAGSRMSDRRAAAPRRVSIDHGNTQAALDSTAFFLTNKRTGHDVLFFGDVEPDCVSRSPRNKRVWQHTASRFAVGKLHLMFLECSFPAAHPTEFLWGHLSVNHLYDELTVLARCVKSERAVLTRRSNLAAGTLRPNGLSGMTAVNQTRSAAGGVAMGASSSSSGAMGSLVPPSPLSAPGSAELKGTLQGLTVVVIHVKQALFPSYAATSGGEGGEQGAERVLDPRSMQERILQELNELEEENELGVRFVIAKQGMRIET